MSGPSRPLFLTGFMGAGKSTVGLRLASCLGLPFVDLDGEIERSTGRKIRDIFAGDGEAAFRTLEHAALKALCARGESAIVATGGGIVMDPENRRLMRESGLIVNLRVDYDDLADRLAGDNSRPLLAEADEETVRGLIDARAAAYAEADLVVGTSGKSPTAIVNEILGWLHHD